MIAAFTSSTYVAIAICGIVVFGWIVVGPRIERWSLTAPILFTGLGYLLSSDRLDRFDFVESAEGLEVLAEVTLVIVLFTDAVKVGSFGSSTAVRTVVRLLAVGLPLCVVFGTLTGVLLFPDADLVVVALLAAVLAPTDAALGQAVVSSDRVPSRIRSALSIESGLNDGLIVPVATILFGLARFDQGAGDPSFWVDVVLKQLGLGVLAGAAVGATAALVAGRALVAGWSAGRRLDVGLVAVGLVAWAAASAVEGSGLIASFVAGLALVAVSKPLRERDIEFVEHEGELLVWLTFLAFGGLLVGPAIDALSWQVVVYSLLSLTVVRMAAVWIALAGTGTSTLTVGFIGWFGPRGLASIVLALQLLLAEDSPLDDEWAAAVAITVVASTLLHGVTARPAARVLGSRLDD